MRRSAIEPSTRRGTGIESAFFGPSLSSTSEKKPLDSASSVGTGGGTALSLAELQADKDRLRAEFAMSSRRLEFGVEQMKAKNTSQLVEIGKKSVAIGRLKLELADKIATLFALEAKERQLADDLQSTQANLVAKANALEESDHALASKQAELVAIRANLRGNVVMIDSKHPRVLRKTSMWGRS